MRLITVLLFVSVCTCVFSQDSTYIYFTEAKNAYEKADTLSYYQMIKKAHRLHPYHPTILYEAAVASAMNGKTDETFDFLNLALLVRANIKLERAEFNALNGSPAFTKLKENQQAMLQPIINSDTAFVIKDRTLHIESITKGDKSGTFYCGSIHKRKIISVDNQGKYADFTTPGADGLTSVFGLKVDQKRGHLWACASPLDETENYDSIMKSGVFQYDLKTKKLLNKYQLPDPESNIFGDLTLDPAGNVYVSDSKKNIVYKIDITTKKFDVLFRSEEFWNLQGITFDRTGENLFIADYIKGLYKFNLKLNTLTNLTADFDVSLKSIDGLTYYNGSLIAIQNMIYPMRVTQYILNKEENRLTSFKIIDRAHPAFNEPTIGFADGDTFYYVANSLWSGYTDEHKLKPADQLQDVVILKSKLK